MNRISRILGTPTNKSATRLGNRSFFSGSLALLLVAAGLTSLGAGCVNNSAAETITREDYGRIAMEMRGAVDSGWLSEEEMTSKLGKLRKQIVPGANDDRRAFREQIRARLDSIEELVASGEMSREDADKNIALIRRRIAAGRTEQAEESRTFTRSDYMRTKKKLDGMVAAGDVSQEDADIRLNRMRSAIASSRGEGGGEAKTFTRAEYARARKKIDGMVAEGEVSREDADTRLGQMRRMIATDRSERGGESAGVTRSEYARAKKKIDGMVLEGEVSREDADTRLGQMRRMIVRADASPQREERKEFDWESTKERIEAAVEAGDITREQADAKYEGIKKRLELGEEKRGESKGAEFDWTGAKKRIEGAVEAGEITREEADARYKGIEARLEAGGETAARATARMEYANAEAKIKARVEAGEVSKEAAEKRLYKMREQFAGDRSDQGKESRTFTREEYARAKKRIDGMVLEGEVSREDADIRLGEMRRRIATDKREGGEVNWDGLKRRIEHAVEAGDLTDEALEGIKKRIEGAVEAGGMTREEADALYEKLEKSE